MSNNLPFEKQRQILHLLVEGNSIRGTARLVDVSPVTVLRHLELAGAACFDFHDRQVRNVRASRIECDEIWSFNYCKRKNLYRAKSPPTGAGDIWTWTALDTESKLVVSFLCGSRDADTGKLFMTDVACRLGNRVQLTTDGHKAYLEAVEDVFGNAIDYAQLVKLYGVIETDKREQFIGADKTPISGKPDIKFVSTSCVEKHNQTMRQHMKRFARKTASHSKKLTNHIHMLSLYTVWYNFVRINSAIRMSPAMAVGLERRLWGWDDLISVIDNYTVKL